jgi:dihydrofolate reductase
MKVILYIASSINGCIADKNGNTNWSAEEESSCVLVCQKIGAVVMGRKTYEEYLKVSDDYWPNKKGTTVILTSQNKLPQNKFKTRIINNGPKGAITAFEKIGIKEIIVVGGNQTWTSFMKEGLVDEIFIDIEPQALGNGKALFQGADFNIRLELIESKPLSSQTIQLHYRVKK